MKVTQDDRINLVNGYNLEISELEPQDAGKTSKIAKRLTSKYKNNFFPGDYVCQIVDKVNKDQVHTVEILGEFIKEI